MHAIFTSFFAYHFGYGPYSYLLNTYKLAELDLLQLMYNNLHKNIHKREIWAICTLQEVGNRHS